MAALAYSNGLRVGGYLIIAALTLRSRQRDRAQGVDGVWPTSWTLIAGLLVALAIGRLTDVGDLLTELGRSRAVDDGWYAARSRFQVAAVAAVGVTWLALVIAAVWRVPERQRRSLPVILAVLTLVLFSAARAVSLHRLDVALHDREIFHVRVGTLTELALLATVGVTTTWARRSPAPAKLDARQPVDIAL